MQEAEQHKKKLKKKLKKYYRIAHIIFYTMYRVYGTMYRVYGILCTGFMGLWYD